MRRQAILFSSIPAIISAEVKTNDQTFRNVDLSLVTGVNGILPT